jgi:hypothetical protein
MTRRRKGAPLGPLGCLVALLAAAPAAAAPPVQFCGLPQKPLLTVDSHRFMNFGVTQRRATAFVFADGTVVYSETVEVLNQHPQTPPTDLPSVSQVARGTAARDVFASFTSALLAARPGLAHDCFYTVGDASDFTDYRLTWYGKGKRKNAFLVSTNLTAPDCGQEIDDLILRISAVVGSTLSSPATETLTSGPFQ